VETESLREEKNEEGGHGVRKNARRGAQEAEVGCGTPTRVRGNQKGRRPKRTKKGLGLERENKVEWGNGCRGKGFKSADG